MRTFRDSEGTEWEIRVNVYAVKSLRTALDLDLLSLIKDRMHGFGELMQDYPRFVDMLFVLCREQCNSRQLSDEDFARRLGGDALDNAAQAFVAEYADFFPDPRVRAGLHKVFSLSRQVGDHLVSRLDKELTEADSEKMAQTIYSQFMKSRESSGSTRKRSPSES